MGKSSKTHLLTKLLPLSRVGARNTQSADHQKPSEKCKRVQKKMTSGEKEEENDDDGEEQTMAEREAWLRSHGVESETAEDRRRMNVETTTTNKEEDKEED